MIGYWLLSLGFAQEVSLHVQQNKLYSGLPFVLTVLATDFEEEPVPEVDSFTIDGCEVQFLGVDPQISRQVSIINGQFSESKEVKYAYRYRVLATDTGSYQIPPISVSQNGRSIRAAASQFSVQDVPKTADMEIHLSFAEGQYWVGQELPVFVDLYLRKDISDQEISVPMFDLFPTRGTSSEDRSLGLLTKFGEILLPISQEKVNWKGQPTTRIRLSAVSELNQAGNFDIPPAKIFADIAVRQVRRTFGRSRNQYSLFQAVDSTKRLVVRPLPLQDQPDAFSGAVGEGFSIQVSASRTVVGVGEPISLRFQLKGSGSLSGVQLPSLEKMGLSPRVFSLPSTQLIGVEQEDGSKQYDVNIQLRTSQIREIPALEFPFFNPKLGRYQIARSEPIALSVKETEQISSVDVFSARDSTSSKSVSAPERSTESQKRPESSGADLSLSNVEQSLAGALGVRQVFPWVILGHFLSVLGLIFSRWWKKGKGARVERGEKNALLQRVETALSEAEQKSAAEISKELGDAVRLWAQEFQVSCSDELARIEIESFSPQASSQRLSTDILDALRTKIASTVQHLYPFLILMGLGWSGSVAAEEVSLSSARQGYQEALSIDDASERRAAFLTVLRQFESLAERNPNSPELWTDYGNAAIGAAELGVARSAYQEALQHNPRLSRARQNAQWVESQLPEWARSTHSSDPLLWGQWFSQAERGFLLLCSFVVLCICFSRRWLNISAVVGLLWLSLVLSLGWSRVQPQSAFVHAVDAMLRTADAVGAPPVMNKELPKGMRVYLLREQGDWLQVSLGSGEKGWLPKSKLLGSMHAD